MLLFAASIVVPLLLLWICWRVIRAKNDDDDDGRKGNHRTMICMGSGGHTAEMVRLLGDMDPSKYSPRMYVMADDDATSAAKVAELETGREYEVTKIYRSRRVGQSYATSVFTTLRSLIESVPLVARFKPDVVLCNGPGTCVPLCIVAAVMNVFHLLRCKIVFVESLCRVETLSLTAKILMRVPNATVVVQWDGLTRLYPNTVYLGRLM